MHLSQFKGEDEPRAYYTEWSKSEREREIPYTNAYIRNLERWYQIIYSQDSSGETDVEYRLMDTGRGGRGWDVWRSNMKDDITICKIGSQQELAMCLRKLKQDLCINLEGWDGERDGREVQEGWVICTTMADLCWGLTENSKIL